MCGVHLFMLLCLESCEDLLMCGVSTISNDCMSCVRVYINVNFLSMSCTDL